MRAKGEGFSPMKSKLIINKLLSQIQIKIYLLLLNFIFDIMLIREIILFNEFVYIKQDDDRINI